MHARTAHLLLVIFCCFTSIAHGQYPAAVVDSILQLPETDDFRRTELLSTAAGNYAARYGAGHNYALDKCYIWLDGYLAGKCSETVRSFLLKFRAYNLANHDPTGGNLPQTDSLLQLAYERSSRENKEACNFAFHFLTERARLYLNTIPPLTQEAEQIFREVSEKAIREHCYKAYVDVILNKARWMYKEKGAYFQAVSIMHNAAEEAILYQLPAEHLMDIYGELGTTHYEIENYSQAIRYLCRMVALAKEDVFPRYRIQMVNTLGLAYRKNHQPDSAIYYFKKGIRISEIARDTVWIGLMKGNIGDVYYQQEKYEQAWPLLLEDAQISKKYYIADNQVLSQTRAAIALLRTGQTGQATTLATEADSLIQRLYQIASPKLPVKNVREARLEWLIFKQLAAEQAKDFQAANRFIKARYALADSLRQTDQAARTAMLEADFVIKQAEKEKELVLVQEASRRQYLYGLLSLLALAIAALALAVRTYRYRNARNQLLRAKAEADRTAEQERSNHLTKLFETQEALRQIEHQQMQDKMDAQNRELLAQTHQVAIKNEVLLQLQEAFEELKQVRNNPDREKEAYAQISRLIRQNLQTDRDWERFKLSFEQVHPRFFQKMTELYPQLTGNDLRLCAYMKMGLTSHEIAGLMGVSLKTLRNARLRLRKKLGLDNTEQENALELFLQRQ